MPIVHPSIAVPTAIGSSLLLGSSQGTIAVNVNHIVRIAASSSYSKLFFANGKTMVVTKVLKWFEQQLTPGLFLRIHRGHLVNTQCISYYCARQGKLMLSNHEWVAVSRRKRGTGSDITLALKENTSGNDYFSKAYNAKLASQCSPA